MRILHLCSYYFGSNLYKSLFENIDYLNVSQEVLVTTYKNSINNDKIVDLKYGNFRSEQIWSKTDRVLYFKKIKKASLKIRNNFEMIHAHTMFSDGGVAYKLFKKYNKPYIVAIRNTDINFIYKYRFDLREYGHEILKNAEKIIFISPSYIDKLIKAIPKKVSLQIKHKFEVIPNGLDEYWIRNAKSRKVLHKNLVYFGEITKNKNIEQSIEAFHSVKNSLSLKFFYVIGFLNKTKYELSLKQKLSNFDDVILIDKIKKEKLLIILSKCDIFLMPSKHETFGLVYLEALSQSIPIIYTKNEGVDKCFREKVGEPIEFNSIDQLKDAILIIYDNYDFYQKNLPEEINSFKWPLIAKKYIKLYNKILKQ